MENKKLTKKENYEMIKEIVLASDVENKEELVAFVEKQVESLEAKAVKAKERAAEKKADGDALRTQVEGLLTENYQTADEITEQVQGADITKSKIIARLTQLVKADIAEKEQVKTEDGKKVMAYRRK